MIMDWRKRWRRRLFGWPLPAIIGENPLEVAMVLWSVTTAFNTFARTSRSTALAALPVWLPYIWAASMALAGVTVVYALSKRREALVAAGMYLWAGTLAAFAVAILGSAGPQRGGVVSGLLLSLAFVCFLRGWWLKDEQAAYIREIVRDARRRKEV